MTNPRTKVITLINQKGGVGKSTMTMNLAACVAEVLLAKLPPTAHSPVAVVSVDPQGSAKWWADRMGPAAVPFYLIQADDDPLEWLRQMNSIEGISHLFVDTPGWHDTNPDNTEDGLEASYSGDVLRTVLDVSDEFIVPMKAAPLCFDPTVRTIEKLILPRGKKFTVVVNEHDTLRGDKRLAKTRDFVLQRKWPIAETAIRLYSVHTDASAERLLVPEYKELVSAAQVQNYYNVRTELWATTDKERRGAIEKTIPPELKAADDFYRLVDELDLAGPASNRASVERSEGPSALALGAAK
ncbi:ParA family protein [Mycobacteroides abscessus]|uniref:ParA family protein n=1 Tax=Mycobacteroides abscessus TaxID=36809 RepID=UPI0009A7D278|nr:ParA family protein [Mycobacteroides abscessus]SLC86493.1 ATPase involved in chromosome partitioning [Mycobacteroides abscessus subsp. abscessus]SLG74889.1 ATPase involved in chromosome partitioning [Mycobacteroides abscessus subsp. abscessus]